MGVACSSFSTGPLTLGITAASGLIVETVAASVFAGSGASFPQEIARVLLVNHITEWLNFWTI